MKGQELGEKFFAYISDKKPPQMVPGETYAFLIGDDEFLVERDQELSGTMHVPVYGAVSFEMKTADEALPEWLAVVVDQEGMSLVIGEGDPFGAGSGELPTKEGFVRAMPWWVKKRAEDPRIAKMLKHQTRAGAKAGVLGRWIGRR